MLRAPQSRDSIIELSLITQQATCREQHLIPASVYFRTQEVRGPNEISNTCCGGDGIWIQWVPMDQWPTQPPPFFHLSRYQMPGLACLASMAAINGAQAGEGMCALPKTTPSNYQGSFLILSLQSLSTKLAPEPEFSQQGSTMSGDLAPQTVCTSRLV